MIGTLVCADGAEIVFTFSGGFTAVETGLMDAGWTNGFGAAETACAGFTVVTFGGATAAVIGVAGAESGDLPVVV